MNIKEKMNMDIGGLIKNGPVNIVILGDSVSHGCLTDDEVNYETVYWNLLKQKMNKYRNLIPVNMINSAIGGDCAAEAIPRLQRDVLCHHPDLVIVCYGLNDVNGDVEWFTNSLKTVFTEIKKSGTDIIYLTPNMLNTYVAHDEFQTHEEYSAVTMEMQNGGKMDMFMDAARKLCGEMDIPVCDCYAEWKKMYESGVDTTMLLANRVNHPVPEMHKLFADRLYDMILGDCDAKENKNTGMYDDK